MRIPYFLTLVLLYGSCEKNTEEQLITGDLFFSEFRLGSLYNLSDSVILTNKILWTPLIFRLPTIEPNE
ncbi:hypothetical protein WBG78_30450 [Chryseolinea sp. T2]|uniref:hypothetical protein n=1 Tax=Chryseolinea sp. T2 TaxID=3129255 RepID=UPI003076C191